MKSSENIGSSSRDSKRIESSRRSPRELSKFWPRDPNVLKALGVLALLGDSSRFSRRSFLDILYTLEEIFKSIESSSPRSSRASRALHILRILEDLNFAKTTIFLGVGGFLIFPNYCSVGMCTAHRSLFP